MAKITEKEAIYLAGVFDHKACVNIVKTTPSNADTDYYRLQIVISSKTVNYLEKLKRMVGGLGYVHDGKVKTWHIVSAQSEKLLRIVEPYVIRKKREVEIALEFRDTVGRPGAKGKKTPDEILEKRHRLMIRLQEAKRVADSLF